MGTRRCTIKRLHVELHRVFGEELISMRELKIALWACIHGNKGMGDIGGKVMSYCDWWTCNPGRQHRMGR